MRFLLNPIRIYNLPRPILLLQDEVDIVAVGAAFNRRCDVCCIALCVEGDAVNGAILGIGGFRQANERLLMPPGMS